ncbi:hypothetical protein VQ042_10940 [Aurantimonas sp. A2-1-M11]|uniref:hypothetical protein n=1 Tax=Aurantimonas sp. A2-1-M11 TaxID=3113712 RepID=UPI002F953F82
MDGRDASGRFTPGNGGRPVGARGKAPRQLLSAIRTMGPVAVERLWRAVHAGERWAIECVLTHILPRDRTIEFDAVTAADIREALASGDLSASEASNIATALAKLHELEIAERSKQAQNVTIDTEIYVGDGDEIAAEKYRLFLENGQ